MCTPALIIAGVSAAATVGGSIMSAANASSVANAQMNAARATQNAQNAGFMQRIQAQSDQNARDTATQEAAIQSENQAQANLAQQQQDALANREQQIQSANDQTQAIGAQAQKIAQDAQNQVTPEQLAQAQAAQKQQIEQLAAPGTSNIASGTTNTPTGPVAAPPQTNNETASAIATRLAQAAAATRDYTANRAQVASYGAPIARMGNVTMDLGSATAPLASIQKAVESGFQNLVEPSTVAYGNAKNYYQSLLNAIQSRTQGQLNVSNAIGTGDITTADLTQADATNAAQNQAAYAAYQAASNPLPGILSSIGSAGLYGAGYLGAGNSLGLNPNSPTSFLNTVKTWANKPLFS